MMQAKVFDDDRSLGDQRLGGLEVDHPAVPAKRKKVTESSGAT
jgi:hypothetical protein